MTTTLYSDMSKNKINIIYIFYDFILYIRRECDPIDLLFFDKYNKSSQNSD